jgi:putative transposase
MCGEPPGLSACHARIAASTRRSWRPYVTAVANVVGFIKGKSAIHLARTFIERKRNFVGQHFWARGYFVSTVGRDEAVIRKYIREQEAEDKRVDQLNLLK